MKDYISKNLCYHSKIGLNKVDSVENVIDSYKTFYNTSYYKTNLKFNDKYNFYINWDVLIPLCDQFFNLSKSIDSLRTIEEKIFSSTKHEIYNNLFIESYNSSRKYIEDVMNNKRTDIKKDKMVDNIWRAMKYILEGRNINNNNLKYLYMTLTNDIEMDNNELDGKYYRLDDVSIGKNHGVDKSNVESFMNDLISYINSEEDEEDKNKLLIKIIICHYYFEFIHPYYDFNGRTGRIIVLWMSILKDLYNELAFFSTALVGYRDKYLKLFKINPESNNIDLTYFVANVIEILIKQKLHYQNVISIQKEVNKKHGVELTSIQRDILIWDQSHRDTYNLDEDSNIKISLIVDNYSEYSKQHIYKEINKLEELGVITITNNKKNKMYKMNIKNLIKN